MQLERWVGSLCGWLGVTDPLAISIATGSCVTLVVFVGLYTAAILIFGLLNISLGNR